eukprot:642373-Pyramimonas_sp.AAC.1
MVRSRPPKGRALNTSTRIVGGGLEGLDCEGLDGRSAGGGEGRVCNTGRLKAHLDHMGVPRGVVEGVLEGNL